MSRRMMLVPEDMYHGMIKTSSSQPKPSVKISGNVSAIDDDNIGLQITKEEMANTLNNNIKMNKAKQQIFKKKSKKMIKNKTA